MHTASVLASRGALRGMPSRWDEGGPAEGAGAALWSAGCDMPPPGTAVEPLTETVGRDAADAVSGARGGCCVASASSPNGRATHTAQV